MNLISCWIPNKIPDIRSIPTPSRGCKNLIIYLVSLLNDGVPAAGEAELVRHVARALHNKVNEQVDYDGFRFADPDILAGSSLTPGNSNVHHLFTKSYRFNIHTAITITFLSPAPLPLLIFLAQRNQTFLSA